jgi:site-specific DNA-methyltransferase (adenine-specific)
VSLAYDADGVRLYLGDCRDVLATVADASVDSAVTDPPYGETSLVWDVPVGDWLPALDRVLKPEGSLWVFGSMRFLAPTIAGALSGSLAPWKFSHEIVWEKHNGSGFQSGRFRRIHEFAAHFYRGAWDDIYKKQVVTMDATSRTRRSKRRPTHTGNIDQTAYVSEDGGPRHQTTVMYCRSDHGVALHPTQKPLGIVRPLIEYSCPPGGLVLDPFAGAGSVGVAARDMGREALLIEIDAGFCDTAISRLSQLTLPLDALPGAE